MDSEKESRKDILLKMHEFYALEARYQRSMMWETVKWFTPILVAVHTARLWIYITKSFDNPKPEIWVCLIVIAGGGITLSVISLFILSRFHRTDLIYITMFAKVEDELAFERRQAQRNAFSADDYITYKYYQEDRKKYKKAESYVKEARSRFWSMYFFMALVFFLSILISLIENIAVWTDPHKLLTLGQRN